MSAAARQAPDELLERPLPASPDAERVLLGSILLDNDLWAMECADLCSDEFSVPAHRQIYLAMCALGAEGKPIDSVTLLEELKRCKAIETAGGLNYLVSLTDRVPKRQSIAHYIKIVRDKAALRNLVRVGNDIMGMACEMNADPEQVISAAEQQIIATHDNYALEKKETSIAQDVWEVMQAIERESQSQESLIGMTLDIPRLDELTMGVKPGELIVVGALPERAKCLAKGTLVLMFDGSIRAIEDVKAGEYLMGPDSHPRKVLSLGHGVDELFDVIPNKGDSYRVNGDHILSLRSSDTGKLINITVQNWLSCSTRAALERYKGWRTGVEFPHRDVTVDPYYLGLWLGDGATAYPGTISNPDEEIIEFLEQYATSLGSHLHHHRPDGKCPDFRITNGKLGDPNKRSELLNMMENLGFKRGDGEGTKHIPQQYIVNSRDVRLRLLAGLMDTDGHLHADNTFQIAQKSHDLAMQIVFLARSLGFAAYWKRSKTRCQTGPACDSTRVTISGNIEEIPTLVKRKQARKRQSVKNVLNTGIKVVSAGVGEYYGVELDGDGLFLLWDFTVTHNTALAMQIARANAKRGERVDVWELEMSRDSIYRRSLCSVSWQLTKGFGFIPSKFRDPRNFNSERDKELLKQCAEWHANLPLKIHKPKSYTCDKLLAHARLAIRKHGSKLLIFDTLKKMALVAPGKSEYERHNYAIQSIANLVSEENVVGIVLHHLSNPAEKNVNLRPNMMWLKESGDIAGAASIVLLPHRPTDVNDEFSGEDFIIVGKMRDGEHGPVPVTFNKRRLEYEPREYGEKKPEPKAAKKKPEPPPHEPEPELSDEEVTLFSGERQ